MESNTNSSFDFNNEKAALLKKSNSIENNLNIELDNIKSYVQQYGKNIAIIGGSLVLTYVVLKAITSTDSKEKIEKGITNSAQPVIHYIKEKQENPIVKQIKSSISLFLISLAKQKLMDYLSKNMAKGE